MLNQILQLLTPEMILEAVKSNPGVVINTLQKFDTFKLLGAAITPELQLALSNNLNMINPFLSSDAGRAASKAWVESFSGYLNANKPDFHAQSIENVEYRLELEDRLRKEITLELREEALQKAISTLPKKK